MVRAHAENFFCGHRAFDSLPPPPPLAPAVTLRTERPSPARFPRAVFAFHARAMAECPPATAVPG